MILEVSNKQFFELKKILRTFLFDHSLKFLGIAQLYVSFQPLLQSKCSFIKNKVVSVKNKRIKARVSNSNITKSIRVFEKCPY